MSFSTVDIIVIAIVLLAALIGLAKGFVKVLFSFCKGIVTFVGAYFLCSPVRNVLAGTTINTKINGAIFNWVSDKSVVFQQVIGEGGITEEMKSNIANDLNMPKFIVDLLNKVLGNSSNLSDLTLGEAISQTLTYYALTIISFVALLIAISIVIWIVSSILTKIFDAGPLRSVNKLLGFLLGFVFGVVIVSVIFLVISLVATWIPAISDYVNEFLDPTNEAFGIARWLYNNNILNWALDNLINAENIFPALIIK